MSVWLLWSMALCCKSLSARNVEVLAFKFTHFHCQVRNAKMGGI
jgi:hypothetical protein